MLRLLSIVVFIAIISGCVSSRKSINRTIPIDQPYAQREFRAAWVATVANIDWPSEPGLPTEKQKHEVLAILDTAASLNLNAIIFQVRPQCDALYESPHEPWSYYLTGTQGRAPEPFYDPLDYWIEEAHNRGIELHVWFNPYRAHHPAGGEITDASIVNTHPELVRNLQNGYYWMDPGHQKTQDHSFNVIMDVVRRYDIDGVHFDDYFYPYGDGNFPDDESWKAYKERGGELSRDDWRRDNVNRFIQRVYEAIKEEKAFVKFGLSPFGIWRPYNPRSIRGMDQYNILYADARLWLNEGWIDYWTPQLYWPVNQIPQSFPVLLGWWSRENILNRNLWPGLFTSRVRDTMGVDENLNQIMITRGFQPMNPGHVHFSMKAFLNDTLGLKNALLEGPYQQQALVPPSPWLDDQSPDPPVVTSELQNDSLIIAWTHPRPSDVFRWVVYYKKQNRWQYSILNRKEKQFELPLYTFVKKDKNSDQESTQEHIYVTEFAVTAVDRVGNESTCSVKEIPRPLVSSSE